MVTRIIIVVGYVVNVFVNIVSCIMVVIIGGVTIIIVNRIIIGVGIIVVVVVFIVNRIIVVAGDEGNGDDTFIRVVSRYERCRRA